jgi:hypothetical protein
MMSHISLPGDTQWERQPNAANFVEKVTNEIVHDMPFTQNMAKRLANEAGIRLIDWLGHMTLPSTFEAELKRVGYQQNVNVNQTWVHKGGLFPDVNIGSQQKLYFKVESVSDFAEKHSLPKAKIMGNATDAVRKLLIDQHNNKECWVLERHGSKSLEAGSPADPVALVRHRELFSQRQRKFSSDSDNFNELEGFQHAHELFDAAAVDLGKDRACDLFFTVEREYWQSRNRAAQVQKARQDSLGLGWANHDHHTYRSTREYFAPMIAFFEKMGFICRERFYAGKEAGWGAQVLEHDATGVIIFADVDLSPDEVTGDFAHLPLSPRASLGTVGLWCQLHGEAFLQAGMHHLECQFHFVDARAQLKQLGVDSMKPFTDFEFLKQSFTKGEVWPVEEERISRLEKAGRITTEQANQFRKNGAIGSHLEILQRDDGYKGFNQTGISEIILKTDARNVKH